MKRRMAALARFIYRNRVYTKSISFILSLVLIFYVIPSTIYAKAAELLESISENTEESTDIQTNNSSKSVYEIEELRESNAKHFRLEDGTFVIARYNDNVHYLDEEGKWQDIDNTISSSLAGYTIPSSAVTFEKKITGNGKLYTVKENGNKITLSLKNANKGVKATVINGSDTEDMTEAQKAMNLEKTLSRVIYYDIQENTDIEYVLHGTDLKENIIVKDIRDSYTYEFELKLNGLVADLDEGGNVIISDKDSQEVTYIIPAPIVYDALGQMPEKEQIYHTLSGKGNKYTLTVAVDPTWMNSEDTIFPVVIDPTITAPDEFLTEDTSGGDTANSELLYVHKNSDVFWRMVNLPELPDSSYISSVQLMLAYHSASGHFTPSMKLRKVQSAWSESDGVNGVVISNNVEAISEIKYTQYGLTYVFDITDLVYSWYENPDTNFGVAVSYYKLFYDAFDLGITTRLYSSESTGTSLHFTYPSMEIAYANDAGIEGQFSYESQALGCGGSGHINLATGSLDWQIPTLSTTSSLLSYTPTLVYNSYLSNIDYTGRNVDTAYALAFAPTGFKLSMCETIVVKGHYTNSRLNDYSYEDSDGTRYVLSASETEEDTFYDTAGLNMKFVVSSDSIILTDDSHLTKKFVEAYTDTYPYVSSAWCLSEITDEYGNKLIFTLDTLSRPTEISLKPAGSTQSIVLLKLVYNNGDRLSMIYNPTTMDAVIFRYSKTYDGEIVASGGKYLRQIEFAVGQHTDSSSTSFLDLTAYYSDTSYAQNIVIADSASYIYSEDGRLIKVIDEFSDRYIEYTWHNDKVVGVTEGSENDVGQAITISYKANSTTVRSSGNDDIILNDDDTLTRYIFDSKGRTVSMYSCSLDGSELYGAKSGAYDDENRENNLKYKSVLGGSSVNYLLNGDFEEYDTGSTLPKYWNCSNASKGGLVLYTDEGYNALSLKTTSANKYAYASQVVFLPAGSYTISFAYQTIYYDTYESAVCISSTVNSGLAVTEKLSMRKNDSNKQTEYSKSFEVSDFVDGGDYVEIKFTLSCTTYDYRFRLVIDNVMLCNTEGSSDYSLVSYGNFSATSHANGSSLIGIENYWSSETDDAFEYEYVSDNPEFGNALKIKKSKNEAIVKQRIYQINDFDLSYYGTQDFRKNAGYDYIVSGFAYAPGAISNSSNLAKFRIGIDVHFHLGKNSEDVVETYYFDFLPGIDGWQFISGTFNTRYIHEDPIDAMYNSSYDYVSAIDIFCEYSNQTNCDAYFDNISVIRADNSNYTEYYYYEEGVGKGLPALIRTGSYYEYYVYDEHKNLTALATSDGDMTIYTYDEEHIYQVNSVAQCRYSYKGEYVLPINEASPIDLVNKYYRSETEYEYDSYGNNTGVTVHSSSIANENDSTETPLKIQSSFTYDVRLDSVMFGAILSETDEMGTVTYYYYDADTCRLKATANSASGNGLVYTYDEKGTLCAVTPGCYVSPEAYTEITNEEKVEYTYGEDNTLSDLTTATTTYGFTYDEFGNRVRFEIGEDEVVSYEYAENNGKLKKVNYANGFSVEYVYNSLEMLKEVWYNSNGARVKAYEYEYTADGLLSSVKDNINGDRTEYTYDHRNRVVRIATTRDSDMHNSLFTRREFQSDGKLRYTQTWIDILSGTNYDDDSVYYLRQYNNDAGNLYNYVIICRNTSFGLGFTYDEFERVSLLSFSMKSFDADYTYTYKSNGEYTTGQIDSVTTVINETTTKSESYTYDAEGNITKITYSDGKVIQYGYDNLGQLISENNGVTGTSGTYTYDDAGNILQVTTGATTNTYSYTDSDWGDLLTSFNGTTITYDNIGNPLSYYNGSSYTFTWQGRRLMTATKGTKNMSFAYDEEGIRISKTVNGVTTNYYYQGSMLYAEETSSEIIVYFYDQNGAPVGFQYRGAEYASGVWDLYAYEKNIFGDIVAVYDKNGTKLVSYTYNAWGECTVTNHTTVPAIVANNAYRYRGYYFDKDLNMYYLQSRYYDANICRFINADGQISSVGGDIRGYNLFAYCMNNPINMTDDSGNWPKWATKLVTAVAIVAVVAVVAAVTVATAGTGTAAACVAAGAAKGAVVGLAVGAATGAASGAISHRISTGSWDGAGEAVLNGMADGALSGAITGTITGAINSNVCFIAGTSVLSSVGLVNIENIRVGDKVYAYDEKTGEVALKTVVNTFENESRELVHVFVKGEEIVCTNEHPFYSPIKGWISACKLRAGDILVSLNGDYVIVEQVQHEILENPVKVYNFEVEDFHTYYVGTGDGVLVHNSCNHDYTWQKERQNYWKSSYNNISENNLQNTNMGTYFSSNENMNRMSHGLAPIGWDGYSVQLHHNYGIKNDFYNYKEVLRTFHIWIHRW